jgi:hypothetical protein
VFPAPGTPNSKPFTTYGAIPLPLLCLKNSSTRKSEVHSDSPPSTYNWREVGEMLKLYKGDEKTGMVVTQISHLPLRHKTFKLRHPVFHIIFFVADHYVHLIDLPTLESAKELAESYYTQWVQVKDREVAR